MATPREPDIDSTISKLREWASEGNEGGEQDQNKGRKEQKRRMRMGR